MNELETEIKEVKQLLFEKDKKDEKLEKEVTELKNDMEKLKVEMMEKMDRVQQGIR